MEVGFVGLGMMGSRMAPHLARAGHMLRLYDRDPGAREAAAAATGGRACDSAVSAAEGAEALITMLPDGAAVRAVVLAEGVPEALVPGGVVLDTSSSEPWITVETAQALAARGAAMVDAPVSGAVEGAAAGTLTFMAGGDGAALERCRPLLDAMGSNIFHLGGVGTGHAMKAINNLIGALAQVAVAEGLSLGKRFGLDPAMMIDVINVSTGMSFATRNRYKERVIEGTLPSGFAYDLMLKDVGIALGLAQHLDMPLPLAEAGGRIWRDGRDHLGPGHSITAIARWVEQITGTRFTQQ